VAAQAFNAAIAKAMPDGLGFDDFESTERVGLWMGLFDAPGCAIDSLFGCAGFSQPLGEDAPFDVSCASCQNRSKNPEYQRNLGPCQIAEGLCFFAVCRGAIIAYDAAN
jgi:hypothetical protein